MNVDVIRASQVHQMPHTGLAHIGPVTKTMVTNATPTSAEATLSQSHFGFRVRRKPTLPTKTMKNATKKVQPLAI